MTTPYNVGYWMGSWNEYWVKLQTLVNNNAAALLY